jgi:hypothetical protein
VDSLQKTLRHWFCFPSLLGTYLSPCRITVFNVH